jgi:sporulation protein YlmC with PRC-barrel domain
MSSKSFHKEELEGKAVIDSSGTVRGKVKDVVFSLDGSVALILEKEDGGEARVSMSRVLGISDYVVMKGESTMDAPLAAAPPATLAGSASATVCRFCGTTIPAGTTWCPSCGRSRV